MPLLMASMCCTDDDPSNDKPGFSWSLVNVTGGPMGLSVDYEYGDIVWGFSSYDKIEVINNLPATTQPEFIFDSGLYDYDYELNDVPKSCNHVLVVNNINFGCQNVSNGTLIYTQTAEDGYIFTFKKIRPEDY